jgi:TolB-like protein/Flp pilus assembly protein TadD
MRPGFLEELKRRKVVRVGVVYLAVMWATVQVTDVFVPALGLPPVVVTVVAVLAIVGFPVSLALAWAFDVTPEGVRREAPRGGDEGNAANPPNEGDTNRWLAPSTLVAAGALLVVGFSVGSFLGADDEDGRGGVSPDENRLAVAVLPFQARGAEDETGFADGVHDDILTQLSRIESLRVTSRTSVQAYRGTTQNIREIAAELGVGSVLEGGVQRTADRVRINMQLIDGVTDEHLWAETYDRELTAENVFQIQSEIARAVADALEATLTEEDEAALEEIPTDDLVALDLYHLARRLFDGQFGPGGRNRALLALEQAVERDPDFVRAWAELTRQRSYQVREGTTGDSLPARQAMDRTVTLADGRVEAALARGNYLYYVRGDYRGALAEFREAAETLGQTTDLQYGIAAVLRRLARHDEATAMFESIVEREPRHARAVFELAFTYMVQRRWADAETQYERSIDLAPDQAVAFGGLAQIALLGRGDTVAARRVIERWRALDEDPAGLAAVWGAQLAHMRGGHADLGVFAENQDGAEWARYQVYPDGPVDLWRARMLWLQGDSAEARTLVDGMAQAYLDETPGARPDANVLPPDGDLFGARATERTLRAWERLFSGDRDGRSGSPTKRPRSTRSSTTPATATTSCASAPSSGRSRATMRAPSPTCAPCSRFRRTPPCTSSGSTRSTTRSEGGTTSRRWWRAGESGAGPRGTSSVAKLLEWRGRSRPEPPGGRARSRAARGALRNQAGGRPLMARAMARSGSMSRRQSVDGRSDRRVQASAQSALEDLQGFTVGGRRIAFAGVAPFERAELRGGSQHGCSSGGIRRQPIPAARASGPRPGCYPRRSVSAGCTRVARCAGIQAASAPTATRSAATAEALLAHHVGDDGLEGAHLQDRVRTPVERRARGALPEGAPRSHVSVTPVRPRPCATTEPPHAACWNARPPRCGRNSSAFRMPGSTRQRLRAPGAPATSLATWRTWKRRRGFPASSGFSSTARHGPCPASSANASARATRSGRSSVYSRRSPRRGPGT